MNVSEIKIEAMQMAAAGLRGQHSNNKVIRLCQEIERITHERDRAVHESHKIPQKGEPGGCLPTRQDAEAKPPAPDSVGAGGHNAYEIPIGTQIVIGKRRWKLVHRMKFHPDMMRFTDTTGGECEPLQRGMYPSEVQALIDAGFKVEAP